VRTLAVISQKGGTGKTTVAVHLAVEAWAKGHRRVLMADLDPQRSAADWRRARVGAGPSLIESKPGALFVAQQAARRADVDLMVLDTRPAGDSDTTEAIRAADLCLVVLRPSFFDLKTVQRMTDMTDAMSTPAIFLLNQAPSSRSGRESPAVLEAIDILRQRGVAVAPIGLRNRTAYQSAVARGLTASELTPSSAASHEVGRLWKHMEQVLWPARPAATARLGRMPATRMARAVAMVGAAAD
jgi:chromosome partitioning protein